METLQAEKPFRLSGSKVCTVFHMGRKYKCSFAFEESQFDAWVILEHLNPNKPHVELFGEPAQHIIDTQLKGQEGVIDKVSEVLLNRKKEPNAFTEAVIKQRREKYDKANPDWWKKPN